MPKRHSSRRLTTGAPKNLQLVSSCTKTSGASLSVISSDGKTVQTSKEKVELLNTSFTSCFNTAYMYSRIDPSNDNLPTCPEPFLEDMLRSKEFIYQLPPCLLRCLQVQWTRRSLCLHAQKYCSQHRSLYYHAKNFNLSLKTGRVPKPWKQACVAPILKLSAPKVP